MNRKWLWIAFAIAATPLGAAEPTETVSTKIVDFGQDAVRDGDGAPTGSTFGCARFRAVTKNGISEPETLFEKEAVEVDGDPATKDTVGFYRFSLDEPMTPVSPWYDAGGRSSKFYGGGSLETANADSTSFHECGVNNAVEGAFFTPRDNWSFFYEHFDFLSPFRIHLLFLWKKAEFLNGGADGRVDLGEDAKFSIYLQRYFMGVDGVRLVVQDKEGYWISEHQWRKCNGSFGMLHSIRAGETAWAPYSPAAPWALAFEPKDAKFAPRSFKDVQSAGFYASKYRLAPAFFGFKFYAFEIDGTVTRPKRPSETLDMVSVAPAGSPAFHITKTEIPFRLWNRVRQDASDNCFADLRGVNFDRDGMAGSQNLPGADGKLLPHGPDEPVTGITFHDAALWCNALSRLESRTPCYYLDAACKEVFTDVTRGPAYTDPRAYPPLFVKWDADGYRLPTLGEWAAASEGSKPAASGNSTQPVGKGEAGRSGATDMLGNVWEFIWPDRANFDPSKEDVQVAGGDFRGATPPSQSFSPWDEQPWTGMSNVGVRVLRREAGGVAPTEGKPDSIPLWSFKRGDRLKGAATPTPPSPPEIPMIAVAGAGIEAGKTEITYEQWWQVCSWAEAKGYSFDHRGQMGSMGFRGFAPWGVPGGHKPQEPATGMSMHDARVWCNALSEWRGFKPVYYEDESLTKPLRASFRYRPLQLIPGERSEQTKQGVLGKEGGVFLPFLDKKADGFRLLASADFKAMIGTEKPISKPDEIWCYDSAGGSTHPVGEKAANALGFHDLFGNVAEWCEDRPNSNDLYNNSRIGGSFMDFVRGCTTKAWATQTTWRYPDVGLRIVRAVPSK